jgi:hypothetical protein
MHCCNQLRCDIENVMAYQKKELWRTGIAQLSEARTIAITSKRVPGQKGKRRPLATPPGTSKEEAQHSASHKTRTQLDGSISSLLLPAASAGPRRGDAPGVLSAILCSVHSSLGLATASRLDEQRVNEQLQWRQLHAQRTNHGRSNHPL